MKERDLQKAILKYLNAVGIYAWRNNTGSFSGEYKGRKRFVRFSTPGAADIFAVLPRSGRFLAIEVKSEGKKPTPAQIAWGRIVNEAGGIWVCIDSWDVFERFMSGEENQ